MLDPCRSTHRVCEQFVVHVAAGTVTAAGTGRVAATTNLTIAPRHAWRHQPRIDSRALRAVCQTLLRDDQLRSAVRHRPNTSLYLLGGRWRYVEVAARNGRWQFDLVAADDSEALRLVMQHAAAGLPPAQLVELLARDLDVDPGEAGEFVAELVAAQLLVPELEPAITGDAPGPALARAVAELPGAPAIAGDAPAMHTASFAACEVTLGDAVVAEIAAGIDVLRRLAPEPSGDDDWAVFRERFAERYGDREVPLAEVLDAETGIGFGGGRVHHAGEALLVTELGFPVAAPRAADGAARLPAAARWARLLALYSDALATGAEEIRLCDADVDALAAARPAALPDTFAARVAVIAASSAAVNDGEFTLRLTQLAGATAARWLSRRCHDAPEIAALARDIAGAEQRLHPHAVLAEVVFAHDDDAAGAPHRPLLRDYEIPYLGRSGAPDGRQITVDDLRLCRTDEGMLLRSVRLGRPIVPLLSLDHEASSDSPALYRFLSRLAAQDLRVGAWDWGPLQDAAFLPRVRRGRVVLCEAQWRIDRVDLEAAHDAAQRVDRAASPAARDAALSELVRELARVRAARRLPRWVVLADEAADPVDLDSTVGAHGLLRAVRDRPVVRLRELLQTPDRRCVDDGDGRYHHELVVPFVRMTPAARPEPRFRAPVSVERRYPPGSRWLYVKLYGGVTSLEQVLRDDVRPLVERLRATGAIDKFFFIRYQESDSHLRLRFELPQPAAPAACAEVERELALQAQRLLDAGLIWRVQRDTYDREVARYGGDAGIALSEALFDADSDAVLDLVAASRGNDDARWLLAIAGVDYLLRDFQLSLDERHAFCGERRDAMGREVALDAELDRRMARKYRRYRPAISVLLLRPAATGDRALCRGIAALERRSERARAAIAAIRAASADARLTTPLPRLLESYTHMHCNRVFMLDRRRQELVIFDFLRRHYGSELARQRWRAA